MDFHIGLNRLAFTACGFSRLVCSALLVLLIIVVVFDTFHHFAQSSNLEKEESTGKTQCTSSLVFPSQGYSQAEQWHFAQNQADFSPSSLKRSALLTDHQGINVATDRSISLALFELQSNQPKASHHMCQMLCTLDQWHQAQHRAQEHEFEPVAVATVAGMDRYKCRLDMAGPEVWFKATKSEAKSRSHPTPRSASPRQRKGKGKNATKGKGTGGKQADAQNYPAIPKAMQPFGGTNSAVDHIIPGGATCSTNANVSGTGSQIQAQNQELVNALRKAYPNMETTPTDVKELIEKTEQNLARSITTNIHAPTRALSKAQRLLQDVTEARRKHRAAWMEYLKDGLQAWESSLEGYRRHQAALQEAAATARADIATARQAIEMNAKAAEDPSAPRIVMAQPIREEIEEAGQEEQVDQEEEKLRSSLQSVLTACAGSLGLAAQPQMTGDNSTTDAQEILDNEDDRKSKRQRSQEPGGTMRGKPASS